MEDASDAESGRIPAPMGCENTNESFVLLTIFIRENRLKRPPMQIQIKHISGSEGMQRRGGEKQFIHHLGTHDSNRRLFEGSGWVRGNDQANTRTGERQGNLRAIEEGAAGSTFQVGDRRVGGMIFTRFCGDPKEGI